MLIEFKINNFRSIRDTQTFSLVATAAKELAQNIYVADDKSGLQLLRTVVIYGANAGGKSNVLSALLFMRWFVLSSTKTQHDAKIPIESFAFDDQHRHQPSEFEITFVKDKVRYQYGFVIDTKQVMEEWLFTYPLGYRSRAQKWFSRIYDTTKNRYRWKFSSLFKGGHKISTLTRNNVLFLSNAVALNNEQLVPIFDWFKNELVLIDNARNTGGYPYHESHETIKKTITDHNKRLLLQFMRAADPSLLDIVIKVIEAEEHLKSLPQPIREIREAIKNIAKQESHKIIKIKFVHTSGVALDLDEESDGTQKLFHIAGYWLDALEKGKVIVVDEIDNSLHPLVVRFLIDLICDPEKNKKGAQLVFSTHDTSLLDHEVFRRDQIWFVEKDQHNATQLYPLSDFSPRKKEAIGKGYLQGRYGALPYIGEWRF